MKWQGVAEIVKTAQKILKTNEGIKKVLKENFGKYWLAGLIFSALLWLITTFLNFIQSNISNYAAGFLPGLIGGLILLIIGGLAFIFVPWIGGRLLRWVYQEFIGKKFFKDKKPHKQ